MCVVSAAESRENQPLKFDESLVLVMNTYPQLPAVHPTNRAWGLVIQVTVAITREQLVMFIVCSPNVACPVEKHTSVLPAVKP